MQDISKSTSFVFSWKKAVLFSVFIFFMAANIYVRLYPVWFPQLKTMASQDVHQQLEWESRAQASGMGNSQRQISWQDIYARKLTNRPRVTRLIERAYQRLKAPLQDVYGRTYFLEADPFHWARYVKLMLANGYPGDTIFKGKAWDTHMCAPYGTEVVKHRFLIMLSVWVYQAVHAVAPSVDVDSVLFLFPVLGSIIFLSILFFFCRQYFGAVAGCFAVLFIGMTPGFLARTIAGRFDTDSLIAIFCITSVWLFLRSMGARTCAGKIGWAGLAGVCLAFFSYTWLGWWIMLVVIGVYALVCAMTRLGMRVRGSAFSWQDVVFPAEMGLVTASVAFFIGYFLVQKDIFSFFYIIHHDWFGIFTKSMSSMWPSAMNTVEELQPLSLQRFMRFCYGKESVLMVWAIALWLGIGIYVQKKQRNTYIALAVWLFITTLTAFKSFRFLFFVMIPAGVILAAGVQYCVLGIYGYARNCKSVVCRWGIYAGLCALGIAGSGLIIQKSHHEAAHTFPLIQDQEYRFYELLKVKTEPEAIMYTWWDKGDAIKAIADRPVIFDGQSQHYWHAYWMGRALTSTNEREAMAALRFLANTSYWLLYDMRRALRSPSKPIELLSRIVFFPREKTRRILARTQLSFALQKKIIDAVHTTPKRPGYLIVRKRMLRTFWAIAASGYWRANAEMLGMPNKIYTQKNIFYSPISLGTVERESVDFKSIGLLFNRVTQRAGLAAEGLCQDARFTYVYDKGRLAIAHNRFDTQMPGCIISHYAGRPWEAVLCARAKFADHILSRLCFMRGYGLKHFDLRFADHRAGMYAYKIKWRK